MKNTIIISGFPGIGKSHLFNNDSNLKILDSDSSKFSWIKKGIRHPNFPSNYIMHIKENLGKADIILVSSHDIVRKALEDNDIPYTIVYPGRSLKSEYLKRYKDRGSDETFVSMMDNKWDTFIDEIEKETFPTKVKLLEHQYLGDVINKII